MEQISVKCVQVDQKFFTPQFVANFVIKLSESKKSKTAFLNGFIRLGFLHYKISVSLHCSISKNVTLTMVWGWLVGQSSFVLHVTFRGKNLEWKPPKIFNY